MTLPAQFDNVAVGTEWPQEDTIVLLNRDLLPGTDPSTLSRFGEDRWRFDDAIFEADAGAEGINFAGAPAPLRRTAKHYFWQQINADCPVPFRSSKVSRPAIRTIAGSWPSVKDFLTWLHKRRVTELSQVTAELLDGYLADVLASDCSVHVKHRRITEVRRLWSYRSLLPEHMRLPALPPWGGDRLYELLGGALPERENRTPRIAENTMQRLLAWSLRFVEDFADDIIAAHVEYQRLARQGARGRRQGEVVPRTSHVHRTRLVAAYLDRLRRCGGSLPGKAGPGDTTEINWAHLGRIFACTGQTLKNGPYGQTIRRSGILVADHAYLETPITGLIDRRPWLDRPVTYHQALPLARHLNAACLVIIAYLSGARPGEILNLRRGCLEHDTATGLILMSGTYFKGATDEQGNKLPAGAPRRDPWVVVEPVARAVDILERLHDHALLFPNDFALHRTGGSRVRKGQARTSASMAQDVAAFVTWISDYATGRGMDAIAPDPRGALTLPRLRRTLAWFIRHRPGGIVAGALQYGHVGNRIFQGYAGAYDSGFPDEYAFEDFLARLDELGENHRKLQAGEHVSGPAAQAYRVRIAAAHQQFAGHALTDPKQARDLIGNPLLQIFHGNAMTCVFDPKQAACQLRGEADDPLTTPDIDDCRPRCHNITRTDRDIADLRRRRDELAEIVADPLAPPIRHQREKHELDRLDTILENHR